MKENKSRKFSKGCRTCMLRRIHCDRALPTCLKCAKHETVCPGYGPNIRWTNGIAVRGHQKGHQIPISSQTAKRSTKDSTPLDSPLEGTPESWSHVAVQVSQLVADATNVDEIHDLVTYYSREVAGRMVWIDDARNSLRRLVIPLARTQPVLLLAIMAVAAEHQAISNKSYSARAKNARDIAILKITDILQSLNNESNGDSRPNKQLDLATMEWVLAAMLILSNYECVDYVSTVWRLHRQGARALIKSVSDEDIMDRELFRFLRSQSACHDILASTTTQQITQADDVVLPESGGTDEIFTDYLSLIYEVDKYSRASDATSQPFMDVSALRKEFDIARGSTLMATGKSYDLQGSKRHDYICLVDAYHYAGLIYSYRCAYSYTSSHPEMIITIQLLFEKLKHFHTITLSAHNLPWPIFIAGVESYGERERQDVVSDLFEMIVVNTGFNNFKMVRAFLKSFWKGDEPDWRRAVRSWESQGRYVLSV